MCVALRLRGLDVSYATSMYHMRYDRLMTSDRETVLRVAADFLARRPNATQDEVAAAVGVSRATLHRYFSGRAALLEALDQFAIAHLREGLKAPREQQGSAADALRCLVAECQSVSGYLNLLYTQSQDSKTNQPKEAWAKIDEEVRALFLRGQREGEFRPDLNAFWLTEAFFNLMAGAAWVVSVGGAGRREFTDMVTDLLLRGVSRS